MGLNFDQPTPSRFTGKVDEMTSDMAEALMPRRPHTEFLPSKLSNNTLVSVGYSAVFTAYGTVGHEFSYFRIPVSNAGDHPHIGYDFCIHPQFKEDLEKIIERIAAGEFRQGSSIKSRPLNFATYIAFMRTRAAPGKSIARHSTLPFEEFADESFAEMVSGEPDVLIAQIDAMLAAAGEVVPCFFNA